MCTKETEIDDRRSRKSVHMENVVKEEKEDDEEEKEDDHMIVDEYTPLLVSSHRDAKLRFWSLEVTLTESFVTQTLQTETQVTSLCSFYIAFTGRFSERSRCGDATSGRSADCISLWFWRASSCQRGPKYGLICCRLQLYLMDQKCCLLSPMFCLFNAKFYFRGLFDFMGHRRIFTKRTRLWGTVQIRSSYVWFLI